METISKQFIAARAVIIKNEKVLVIKEAPKYQGGTNHGKYDFPGGKVKLGESIEDALIREAKEEVGADIKIMEPFFVDEWRPVIKGERTQIIGIFFKCELLSDKISLSSDHDEYKWTDKSEYQKLPLIQETKNALDNLFNSR